MHEPFHWNLLFSFLLHLRIYQTHVDELVETLHRYYLWLVYQRVLGRYTKNSFTESSKGLHSLELTCCKGKFCVRRF